MLRAKGTLRTVGQIILILFVCFFFFVVVVVFETGFLCVALAVLELTL